MNLGYTFNLSLLPSGFWLTCKSCPHQFLKLAKLYQYTRLIYSISIVSWQEMNYQFCCAWFHENKYVIQECLTQKQWIYIPEGIYMCEKNTSRVFKGIIVTFQIPMEACSNDADKNIIYCLWSTAQHSLWIVTTYILWNFVFFLDQQVVLRSTIKTLIGSGNTELRIELTPLSASFTKRISSRLIEANITLFWAIPSPAWPLIFVSLSFNHRTVANK